MSFLYGAITGVVYALLVILAGKIASKRKVAATAQSTN